MQVRLTRLREKVERNARASDSRVFNKDAPSSADNDESIAVVVKYHSIAHTFVELFLAGKYVSLIVSTYF